MKKRILSKKMTTVILAILAVIVICGCAVYAYSHLKHASDVMTSDLVIENTGSTNTAGWKLTVKPDGSGTLAYTNGSKTQTYHSGTFATKDFVSALKGVSNLSDLKPTGQLMKSTSFGTSEYAQYEGHKSGDLNSSYEKNNQAQKRLQKVLASMVKKAGPTLVPRFQTGTKIK